jgi:DNA-binding NarL/FixJ family response regulator
LTVRRRIGDQGGIAHVLTLLARLAVHQGAYAQATVRYHESLALREQLGDQESIAPILEGMAAIAAAGEDRIRAVHLAAAADALRAATGVLRSTQERTAHDRTLASLRGHLSARTFTRVWQEGQALSPIEAIAVAMALPGSDPAPGLAASAADASSPGDVPDTYHPYNLTPREVEVLRLLTHGLTYAQIGEALVISPRTVDAHVRAIFSKLDVRSRSAARRRALENRLI